MTKVEHWERVKGLFQGALSQSPGDRDAFLQQRCGPDRTLQAEVESLLAAHEAAGSFAERPAVATLARRVDRIGAYEIVSPLGAGGMGEVYRARDSKLGRDVALKILPAAFAIDPDRLARFRREARVLASLNCPSIAAIYGFEESDGVEALVLELVEGPTLAEKIAQGRLPLDEALTLAKQVAQALEAAHDAGIIHRDLKPANIKVRADGTVKVLDFGLAKALAAASASCETAVATTPSRQATEPGLILGTAAYMSPEQAKGHTLDKRADLWAFGAVLYEMLTGGQVFQGPEIVDILARVLTAEPDWSQLPQDTPATIRRLLRRCLEKDRARRLDSAAAARLEIDDALSASPADTLQPAARSRIVRPLTIASLAAGAVITALAVWGLRPARQPGPQPARFTIVPPPGQPLTTNSSDRDIVLSPDGRYVVYRSGGSGIDGGALMVRAIDQLDAYRLPGVTNARRPFFSADSRWIGYFERGELKKMSIGGGPAIPICTYGGAPRGASWGDDDTIVFATQSTAGLRRVAAKGGEATVLSTLNAGQHESAHWYPSMLPGDRGVLFTIPASGQTSAHIVVLDLKTGQTKTLIRGGSDAEYLETGHLLYGAEGSLRAVRFDLATLDVRSESETVVPHVLVKAAGAAEYAVSRSGTLVYVPGEAAPQTLSVNLIWVDRQGHEVALQAPRRPYLTPRLSPDGTRVAVQVDDKDADLWIWDIARQTLKRLTFDPAYDGRPVWTPDNQRIIFASNRAGVTNLYSQAADGTGSAARLTTSATAQYPTSIAADGMRVIGWVITPKTAFDVVQFLFARPAGPWSEEVLIQTPFDELNAELSPDNRYLAYQANETGRYEIYVRPFPQVNGGRWQISTEGGSQPAWSRNGRELFFLDGSNSLAAVPIQDSAATFSAGNPVKLFDAPSAVSTTPLRGYDVSPNGQRFLMLKDPAATDATTGIVVVEQWFEELRGRIPTQK